MPHDHGIEYGKFFVGELILLQLPQTNVWLQHDLSTGWFQITAENFHKGRLATAVGTDQAVAIAVIEFDRNVFKQGFSPELHSNIGGRNHKKIQKEKVGEAKGAHSTGYSPWNPPPLLKS